MNYKKTIGFKILLYFFLLLFFSCTNAFSTELKGKVARISDGDTFWVRLENGNKIKVRVWGIDTPEKFESKKLFREANRCGVSVEEMKRLGKLASEKAKELLDHSKVVLKEKGRGYYGRFLAEAFLPDGTNYGLEIIEEGYACVYRKNYNPDYLTALGKAKKERKGLWNIEYELMRCLCGK